MTSSKTVWAGRVLSAIPIGMMLFSAALKFHPSPQVVEFTEKHLGYPTTAFLMLAILEITCVVVYAIPQTAVLGAILMTGYLGGAIASHFRVGDMPIPQVLLIMLAWGGLYLRDERLRALLPLRKLRHQTPDVRRQTSDIRPQ
jgi:DoxX-like protein